MSDESNEDYPRPDDIDDEQLEALNDGLHGAHETHLENFRGDLHIGNLNKPEPPTVQFSPTIAPNLGIPERTQRELERMRAMIRNGAIALCIVGAMFLIQTVTSLWQGTSQRTKDDNTAAAIKSSNAAVSAMTEQMKSQQEFQALVFQQQKEDRQAILEAIRRKSNSLADK